MESIGGLTSVPVVECSGNNTVSVTVTSKFRTSELAIINQEKGEEIHGVPARKARHMSLWNGA